MEARTQISCVVEVPEDFSLPFELATPLFRICQEALTNVTRHAEASEVSIQLDRQDGRVFLTVCDNGRGITDEEIQRQGSLGLLGMKERVSLLGGTLDIKGIPGKGTTVAIDIPMDAFAK